jgi:predicted MPP superfamily phosphohydrolase
VFGRLRRIARGPKGNRRRSRGFAIPIALAVALPLYPFWIEPQRLVVTRIEVPVDGLSQSLRLMVIGDVQPAGPHEDKARIEAIVDRANGEAADIVLLLGDYVSERKLSTAFVDPRDTAKALGRLTAPLGVHAVLGNHDWWWDGPAMRRLLRSQGIDVLEDRAVRVQAGGQGLWIAGLSDPVTQAFDLEATLAQTDGGAPTILLSHTPDIFPRVPGKVALTLAGHTHGGQVYLPFIGRPLVPSRFGQRYAYGHIVEQGRNLYVTGGIGTAIIPVRFLVPPEIVVITLVPRSEGPSKT